MNFKINFSKIKSFDMKVNIESPHFKVDNKLVLLINEKINKLIEHHSQLILNGDVILRIGDYPENKIVEIKLNCEGCNFIAKKNSETFEQSLDMVVEALRRQLRKKKTKTITRYRNVKKEV